MLSRNCSITGEFLTQFLCKAFVTSLHHADSCTKSVVTRVTVQVQDKKNFHFKPFDDIFLNLEQDTLLVALLAILHVSDVFIAKGKCVGGL